MSWSISVPVGPTYESPDLEYRCDEAFAARTPSPDAAGEVAVRRQFMAARDALGDLIVAVAPHGELVSATLSGHANPEHVPRGNYGNDFITITLNQATEAKTNG